MTWVWRPVLPAYYAEIIQSVAGAPSDVVLDRLDGGYFQQIMGLAISFPGLPSAAAALHLGLVDERLQLTGNEPEIERSRELHSIIAFFTVLELLGQNGYDADTSRWDGLMEFLDEVENRHVGFDDLSAWYEELIKPL